MRVAILLTGQMRRFMDIDVQQSLQSYFHFLGDVDIFVSTWSDRGISYNHGSSISHGDEKDIVTISQIQEVFPQSRTIAIHDIAKWEEELDGCWKQVYTEGFTWNGTKIRGTVVPQLFTLRDANRARLAWVAKTGIVHDLVLRVRPDVLFAPHLRCIYESVLDGEIHAINNPASGTFYAQRIYDIFFFGKPDAMNCVCETYTNFQQLLLHPWQNGLHVRDACRCLYVQARFYGNIAIKDIPLDICKVKR